MSDLGNPVRFSTVCLRMNTIGTRFACAHLEIPGLTF
jgi:hypothetical protein